jgi:Methyltransferase domain
VGAGRTYPARVFLQGAEGSGRRAKLAGAMQLLAHDPRELYEAVVDQAERAMQPLRARPSGATLPLREVATGAGAALDRDVAGFLDEDGLTEIDEQVRERTERLGSDVPFPLAHNAAPSLARTCYALCRALRPAVVLETGVAYGVSSSFITKALELNGTGHLHSVDRAPVRPGVERYIGVLVPDELRSRWTLHRGTSRRLVPRLLPQLDGLALFIHDSQHTYRNVSRELRTVAPHLVRPAVVVVDDTAGNRAFEDWVESARPGFAAVIREEPVGVAVIG